MDNSSELQHWRFILIEYDFIFQVSALIPSWWRNRTKIYNQSVHFNQDLKISPAYIVKS